MSQPQLKEWLFQAGAILLVALFLFSMIQLRVSGGKDLFMNGESYYNLRMARELSQDPFLEEDAVQGAKYYPSAYHYTLVLSLLWLGEYNTTHFAPIFFGMLFTICFAWLLTALGLSKNNASFTSLLLIVTPVFLVSFSSLSQAGFTALLSLVALALYFEKNYWDYPWKISGKICFGLSIFFLTLLSVTSLVGFAVTILLGVIFSLIKNRALGSLLFAAMPSILLFIPLAIFTDFLWVEWRSMGFHIFSVSDLFALFGSELGLGLFMFLLFFTGLVIMWGLIRNLRVYHLFSLLLVIASFFNPLLRVYSSLIILVYAVVAIKHLYYTKWELDVIKTGTVILLLCALVFSSLSQTTAIVKAEPSITAKEAMKQLAKEKPGMVFTSPDYGFFVQEYAGKPTFIDANSRFEEDYPEKAAQYALLLGLTRITDAQPALNQTGISYFFITPEMKEDAWNGKEKGLLLLLKNSAKFERLYSNSQGFEVWKYNPED